MRRAHQFLALASTSIALALAACGSFSGSDSPPGTTNDGGANATDGGAGVGSDAPGVREIDSGVAEPDAGPSGTDGGSGGGSSFRCDMQQATMTLFCNDFDMRANGESPYAEAGAPPSLSTARARSPPDALEFVSVSPTGYVTFRAGAAHTTWALSFWVYLDPSFPPDTEFAYVQPGSSPLSFKTNSTGGVTVATTDVVVAPGWVHVEVQATDTSTVNVTLAGGKVGTFKLDNTMSLVLGLGVLGSKNAGTIWFDDVLATYP